MRFVRSLRALTGMLPVAMAFALFVIAGPASAQKLGMLAPSIDAVQETPPNNSTAIGSAAFVLDRQANRLDYYITFGGLSSTETQAHIHGFSAPGTPSGILHALPLGSPKIGSWNYMESQEQGIVDGLTYVNIHSMNFTGGEIRGQILIDGTPQTEFAAKVDSAQEVPPNGSTGTGTGSFTIDTVLNTLSFNVTFSGLSSTETDAHIHAGPPGVSGSIIFVLPLGSPKMGVWNYPEAQEANILNGDTYVNIHTVNFGGGEIRGQILPITNPNTFCQGKVNSIGCTPAIGSTGTPTLSSGPDTFTLTCTNAINNKNGLFFWGNYPANLPFSGGTLCVKAPITRFSPTNSGGNPPPNDCSGTYTQLFSQAYMASKGLQAGDTVYSETWMRDPNHPDGTAVGFSNGLQFILLP